MAGIRDRSARSALRRVGTAALCIVLLLAFLPLAAGARSGAAVTHRINGSTVYETAAMAAGATCDSKTGSHSIVLASGENWPDALAGSALDRPLLLTTQAFLPAATRAYLSPCREHPKAKVIILGGPAAVSAAVEADLRDMGFRVDRIAGADRYETAHRVARLFAPEALPTVYLASGRNFADAVAAAPSVSRQTPLVLTAPGALHDQARQFLTAADRTVGVVTILGGPAAIAEAVAAEVRSLGLLTRRIAGADRYETASLLARESLGLPGCHPVRDVAVASGSSPYGGLAASAVRGPCQPLLLAPEAGREIPASLASFGQALSLSIGDLAEASVTGIGAASQVPDEALMAVATGTAPESASLSGSGDSAGSAGSADWEQLADSVVQVVCSNAAGERVGSGSGFVVGDGLQIVTNHHVVTDARNRTCSSVSVRVGGTFSTAPTHSADATVVRSSHARDLALLSLDPSQTPLRALDVATVTPRAGDAVTVLGYPGVGGDTMTLTTGRYSGTTRLEGQVWIKTDAQIAHGNSGGPALDAQGRLVGVPTRAEWIFADAGETEIAGLLGLLVPAADVAGLLDGSLGSPVSDDPIGDGEWRREFTTNGRDPYIALLAQAQDHSLTGLYAAVEPGLFVFCDDEVQVDFWWPVTERWGQGPYIAGQIDYLNRGRHGRVPVGYRVGGKESDVRFALWRPTSDNRGFTSGDSGFDFVTALLAGKGELALAWTNWDDSNEIIVFPSIDGFASAYDHLEAHCS